MFALGGDNKVKDITNTLDMALYVNMNDSFKRIIENASVSKLSFKLNDNEDLRKATLYVILDLVAEYSAADSIKGLVHIIKAI